MKQLAEGDSKDDCQIREDYSIKGIRRTSARWPLCVGVDKCAQVGLSPLTNILCSLGNRRQTGAHKNVGNDGANSFCESYELSTK